MSDNTIGLKSISELLGMKFFIPSYQRGYRWTSQQVEDLLNDVWEFANKEKKESSEFYCLQPLVVKKDGEQYIVIDGQQRLTTIYLIIHYFNEMWEGKQKIPEPQLTYETRAKTSKALKNIEIENDNVKCEDATDNIDTHHILCAYKTIHDWVSKQGNSFDRDKFKSDFRQLVQVIWYEIAESDATNPIDTFTRLNIGKIPLTNAELVKALFLRKGNFSESADRWQIEIASEWDNMEYKLQDDAFWYFLANGKIEKSSRIEFLFDVMCEIATDCKENIGTDSYKTFRFFNNKFEQVKDDGNKNHAEKIWAEIKEYFCTFEEWFENPVLYHYIGYLVCVGEKITEIYNLCNGKKKDELKKALCEKIKSTIKGVKLDELEYVNVNIRKVLLLLNIQHLLKQNENKTQWYIRFPFDLYVKEKWDIEHIAPQTSPEMFEKFDF